LLADALAHAPGNERILFVHSAPGFVATRLARLEGAAGDAIRAQQATILFSLKDADISVRRRALALLFTLCNRSIAVELVKELLATLAMCDWQFRDELVLKIAILAERHAPDLRWFVDTIIALIGIAGDHVSDDVWHRVVQVVTNNEDLQRYAASKLYHALEPVTAHETAVKAGAYILGEFGFLLNDGDVDEGAAPIIGVQQFAALHQHFPKCSTDTKAILLSAYAKMQNLYPELKSIVVPVFEAHVNNIDAELQQRAVEYLNLPSVSEEVQLAVLEPMPEFPVRASHLEEKLRKQEVRAGRAHWRAQHTQRALHASHSRKHTHTHAHAHTHTHARTHTHTITGGEE
jgi:AP-2 complex subunit alpha